MNAADLIKRLRTVFPAQPVRGQIVTHNCRECLMLENHLRGATWKTLVATFVEEHSDILPLLSREAYLLFIPAWLRQAVVEPDGEAASMVLVNLSTASKDGFNSEQTALMLDCAQFGTANNVYGPNDPVNVDALAAIRKNFSLS